MSTLALLARAAKNHRAVAAGVKWNAADKDASVVLSSGDTVARFPTADRNIRGDVGHSTGLRYFRLRTSAGTTASGCAGVANATASLTARPGLSDANSWAHQSNANKLHSGFSSYGNFWDGASDELMVAVNFTTGNMWFGKNGTWMASGDPVAGTNPSFTGVSGTLFPIGNSPAVSGTGTTLTFIYDTPPSGYTYW